MRTFYFKRDSDYDKEYGNKDWLYINNCGYYFNITKDITTVRSVPRADYHLLYVSSGELCINGITLKSGEAYLLLPQEPHAYIYKQADGSRYYWIHFTGNRVSEILSHCEIQRGINTDNGQKQKKDTLFAMLTEELAACFGEASDFAVSLFFSFLSLFKKRQGSKRFYDKAVRALESKQSTVSVSSLARSYNVSASHFIRSFKKSYQKTPARYRTAHRIQAAKNLLQDTRLSVGIIAELCGYSDALYFARIFKKSEGISPSEYRRKGINLTDT